MPESTGKNQGIYVLEDFVCEAIPAGPANFRPADSMGRGINQGVAPLETILPDKPKSEEDDPPKEL